MALSGCLDTRFYFAHAEGNNPWTKRLVDSARQPGSRLVSSSVTVTELLSEMGSVVGLETVQLRIRSAKLAGISFIPVSEEIAAMAGEMALKNRDLPMADALIAATALRETGGRVYTDDPHFSRLSGIHPAWGRC